MKKSVIALCAMSLLLVLFVSGCSKESEATAASDSPKVIKVGHVAAESTPVHQGMVKFKEILEEKSNGRFVVDVYPNSALGGNRELIEQLQFGTLEMCAPSAAFLGGFTDKTALFDLPYLFKSNEAAWKVFDSEVGRSILNDLEASDLIGIDWFAMGWRNVTSNKEVHDPADLGGQKLRVMENQMHIDHFNTLGASAIPMAFSEVYTSLQQGVIDAQENPYSQIETQRFYEVQDYLIETKHIYDPTPLIASKIFWDSLTDEEKDLITESSKEALVYERNLVNEIDENIKQKFLDEKMITIVELTPEERASFRAAAQPVYDQWESKIGADLIEKAEALQEGM